MPSNSQLSLTPLGAGDLIDRAVRFYRQNFWTFVWIAAPPILVGTVISIGWSTLGRSIFSVNSSQNFDEYFFYALFTWLGNLFIWVFESIAALTVMGGASRNFVRHLLFDEPITFRETYKNVRERFFALVAASTLLTLMLSFIGLIIFYFGFFLALIAVGIAVALFSFSAFLTTITSIILGLGAVFLTGWLFFLIASRFAYVPQVVTVEGQGVFAAVGRSTSLARGNVKRFAALFVFTTVAAYSALLLLYVPLGWYAWANGVEFFAFNADVTPAWYEISNQVISQASFILLLPIWMIGLCLLYVDERVRYEGYDIELMAARSLGEIPAVPRDFINPLQPALAQPQYSAIQSPRRKDSSMSPLGLN
jgi:hypothetical protein